MKTVLYLGTTPPKGDHILHYPMIALEPKNITDPKLLVCLKQLALFSHVLFTSKNAVEIFFSLCRELGLDAVGLLTNKCLSIGPITSLALQRQKVEPLLEASITTQEGLIEELKKLPLQKSYLFYPRSSLARSCLKDYLQQEKISVEILDLYDTKLQKPAPIPSLEGIEEIVFTSPSTVEGFFQVFTTIPSSVKISFQGPVTEKAFFLKVL